VDETQADKYTKATLEQLHAEVAAAGIDLKALAGRIGLDYNTFWRYTSGKRAMPMHVFWAALDALKIDEQVFVRRARERLND